MDVKEIFCEGAAPAWCAGEGVERVSCCLLQHSAPGAIPEPQFPFFVGFCGHCPGAAPQHIPPASTVKKKSLIILSPKIPVKPWLCPGEGGHKPFLVWRSPQSQPDGAAGPSTGSGSGFVLVLLVLSWFPAAPAPCCSIPSSQFPVPKSLFSPPCAPAAPC